MELLVTFIIIFSGLFIITGHHVDEMKKRIDRLEYKISGQEDPADEDFDEYLDP